MDSGSVVTMRMRNAGGFTLIEALIALVILTVGLVALPALLSQSFLNVYFGGAESKATSYARQIVEQLKSQPINAPCNPPVPLAGCFPPPNGNDTPEAGITRTWTVAQVGATIAPNRLWQITVTVDANQSGPAVGTRRIAIETMRAE